MRLEMFRPHLGHVMTTGTTDQNLMAFLLRKQGPDALCHLGRHLDQNPLGKDLKTSNQD